MKKVFSAALIVLGITLDTYFYAFRFIADGLPIIVAVSSGIMLEFLLSFAVYNIKRSKALVRGAYITVAVAITMYAVIQTSAGQTFALLSHTASIGVATENNTASFTMEQCKQNLERLTVEASSITTQLKSLQSVTARAAYAGTISAANRRLAEITRERARLMDTLLKTSSTTVTDARTANTKTSIYGFYAGMVDWKKDDWLKFLFHFALSIFIAIAAPIGILAWGGAVVGREEYTRQQVETFVAGAWYRVRNNTGSNVLSEIEYNSLLQKRGYLVESGVYFALMNRCGQLGLINASGVALEKDHKKVIAVLSGEKVSVWKTALEKIKSVKAR
jgi:uncharacterized membrane protein (Fun14 family)